MSWDMLSDLTYWIFFRPGDSVSVGGTGTSAIKGAVSPRVVTGLTNGTQYALLMNATRNDSAAGPNSNIVLATPRLAGDNWIKGSVQGAQNLNALAFNGGSRYVTVGDGTTLFAGDFDYGHTNPVGVTQWFTPTTPPTTVLPAPPFATDFRAVIFNGFFVALGSNGAVAISADGVNWSAQNPVQNAGVTGLNGLAFISVQGTGTYVAVGDGGQMYMTTNLGVEWTRPATAPNTTSNLTGVALLNGFAIVTGADSTLLVSADGVNWVPQATGLPPGMTLRAATFMPIAAALAGVAYAVVGDGGAVVTTTQIVVDANNIPSATWTPTVLPGGPNLRSVTVGGATGTRFLAIGQGGAAVFADSVINSLPVSNIQWIAASQPTTGDFSSVHFFTGQYLAVGAAGANAVSH